MWRVHATTSGEHDELRNGHSQAQLPLLRKELSAPSHSWGNADVGIRPRVCVRVCVLPHLLEGLEAPELDLGICGGGEALAAEPPGLGVLFHVGHERARALLRSDSRCAKRARHMRLLNAREIWWLECASLHLEGRIHAAGVVERNEQRSLEIVRHAANPSVPDQRSQSLPLGAATGV